jgi:hypothetical protein
MAADIEMKRESLAKLPLIETDHAKPDNVMTDELLMVLESL